MPNKRSGRKVHLGGFVDKLVRAELKRQASKEGFKGNLFGYVQKVIIERLADNPLASNRFYGKADALIEAIYVPKKKKKGRRRER